MKIRDIKQELRYLISIHDEETGRVVDSKYLSANDMVDGKPVSSVQDAVRYWEKYLKKPGLRANISDVKMGTTR